MGKTVYIETMGCQMNKLDSQLIEGQLKRLGYIFADQADEAGVIIFNTCSVRQHAEDKVISKIGQLRRRHQQQKNLVLAVVGCMAQRMQTELLENYSQVDIVCSPGRIHQLGELIQQVQEDRQPQIALNDKAELHDLEELDTTRHESDTSSPFMAYVRVMRGCNKYCSYCVVPHVRGPEISRPPEHVLAESRRLVESGVKEITLLGQTVNSYKYTHNDTSIGLADILEQVHEIEGLQRLRFVTSYPRDFDESILHAMTDLPKVCEYLHIPAQAGSDKILKAMNRRYTADQYLDLIDRARWIVPDISIAGDFIVGFPGETDEDFQASAELMQAVRFKNCFIFKYSPRPGTRADDKLADSVPDEIKKQRNQHLLGLQSKISLEDNQKLISRSLEILVEGPSKYPHLNEKNNKDVSPRIQSEENISLDQKSSPDLIQLVGRTRGDHIVVFQGSPNLIGQIIPVTISRASALTLFAQAL
jgi:tRNA-2-methylthio-N6-dimethylallyladenosine synthase